MNLIEQYQATQQLTAGLMQGVSADQMDAQTPCSEWDVRALCNHMIGGNQMMAGALAGADIPGPGTDLGDLAGDDPAGAFRAASDAMVQAASAEGALEQTYQMPFGEVPGAAVLSLAIADTVTHAWDLAQATGQGFEPADELVATADGVWQQFVSPEFRAAGAFAEAQEVGEAASALDRLIAFTGRTP